jgi:hypothetical protein
MIKVRFNLKIHFKCGVRNLYVDYIMIYLLHQIQSKISDQE